MAFILVQHLDPTHASMMVELLATHTTLSVVQATDGMSLEPDHLYVIPPATYLSVEGQTLRVTSPRARRGARLPFDFLLHSLAEEYGGRAVCVILSGTGADGSVGLRAVKERGGFVIAQDPAEAAYGGMPHSAILTGCVNLVLPVAGIAEALVRHQAHIAQPHPSDDTAPTGKTKDRLLAIVDLLRTRTVHDFTQYKHGTLQRRIERRMAAAEIDDMDRYLDVLRGDSRELDRLAKDLLINVTRFFRDSEVFDLLAGTVIPDLVDGRPPDQSLRIWTAGCSTGEETYSLAMLVLERIAATATSDQAAGLRIGRRRGRGRLCAGRPVSRVDRGRRNACKAGTVLRQGGSRLPRAAGAARRDRVRRAGRPGRSAVLPSRRRVVPQPAHLSAPGSAGEGAHAVPLRAPRSRSSSARQRGDRRPP